MAERPVFVVNTDDENFVLEKNMLFRWFPGFAKTQKQKSINSLHESFLKQHKDLNILEISTSSTTKLGIDLSAFNLMAKTIRGKELCSVESLFQSSKKFENGGPYIDLIKKNSVEAKKDPRLRSSGDLVCFMHKGEEWPLEPKAYFYDWIYMNTLDQYKDLTEEIVKYDAFTDIEFNPAKSINCQARSAALYVSLYRRGVLKYALKDKDSYFKIIVGKV